MRILCLADIHATERPPSSCTDTYWPDLLDLLMQTCTIAHERQVRAVVWAGDVFHHKAPSRTSHRLVQSLIEVIKGYPCPVYIVPGNHDMQNDRIESVNVTQPLGVLYEAGARLLSGWEGDNNLGDELPLFGVPWLQEYGAYTEESDHAVGKALERYADWEDREHCLVVAHAPLYPPDQELEYEYFPASRWAEAMGWKGSCFYGHVHEPHGVWKLAGTREDEHAIVSEVGKVTFCNNGALSRGSLHEYNLKREVGCTIWWSNTGVFEFVPLDARPASEVFRLEQRDQAVTSKVKLDEFLADIGSTKLEVLSVESVLEHIRSLGLGSEVVAKAEELLAQAMQGGK